MKKGIPTTIETSKGLFALKLVLALCFCSPLALFSQSGANTKDFWRTIKDTDVSAESSARQIVPNKYLAQRVDLSALKSTLLTAPLENNSNSGGIELYLPLPDGTFGLFRIWYSPIMEKGLADKYPDIRTYAGFNVNNPSVSIRLDMTPKGFHAMTYGGGSSVFIDPYAMGNTQDYITYYKRDFVKKGADQMICGVGDDIVNNLKDKFNAAEFVGDCGIRHQYRLALSCSGEYAAFHGGTVALALAAMTTTMNRVNGVFERDGSIRMNIIANNNLIVYTNAGTDPFSNPLDDGVTIGENQTNIDAVIGNANYDIGHVFTNSGSGLAAKPSVCVSGAKASATTGSTNPVGDPFDIDYVAHEIGHQFDGDHTQYNDNCNRNNSTAIEPGSGSTIMGYAGVCSPSIGSHSDAYFCTASVYQIRNYVATGFGNTCDVEVAVTNSSPTVTALSNYSIPLSTPFIQTAVATDPNGNTLTYCWEQNNAWSNPTQTMPPASTNVSGPVFRSLSPVASPSRVFPNLTDLFNNVTPTWEVLPSVARSMAFRVTVRDNVSGGGCTGEASNTVTTVAGTGPFLVTSPNTAVTYAGNSSQTITWNVAGTTAAPISCANVNILLTTDGGNTFTTLLANTPNDGTQVVTMPNITTTTARVWIQCSNNIFFDVSNVNFTINAVAATCTELFFSEYVEGSGNNKALEIYNPTSSPIVLTGNYSVRMYFNGSTTVGTTVALVGTIAPYDVFVLAFQTASAGILAVADQTSNASFYNGDDAIELYKVSTGLAVDVIGQIGFDPGTEWGTGLTSTADNTIRRKFAVNAGDTNGSNVFDPAIEWDGYANDNIDNLGAHSSVCQPPCSISSAVFSNVSGCNNNGTPGDPSDDYFTANVQVTFVSAPTTGTLTISGDAVAGGGALSVSAVGLTSPYTFTGVRFRADGTVTNITLTFSADPTCTFSTTGPTVASCSVVACNLVSAGLTDVHCEDNLETPLITDDYIWFQLNPTGTGLGTGYNVTVNTGSVTLNGLSPATNVPYGSSNYFRLQSGSAGSGNVTVTITDASTGACTVVVVVVDPGSCSALGCSLTSAGLTAVQCNNNGTTPNAADDYISFSLNPTGTATGNTYSVTVSAGTITLSGGGAASGVAYGAATGFRLQNGSAGGGNVTVYLADDDDPDCTISVVVTDPGSCSAPGCSLTVSCPPTPSGVYNCNTPLPAPVTTEAAFEALGGNIDGTLCGNLTITSTTGAINNCSSTSVTRTYTIFDDLAPFNGVRDGNETFFTCNLTYTYAPDQTPPVLTCPSPVFVSCASQVPAVNVLSVTNVSDNCNGAVTVTFVNDNISGQTCANRYTISRVYRATDACNNSATCNQIITVNDQTAPVFNQSPLPANITISCTDNLPVAATLTGNDNCGGGGSVPNVIWINEFHYDNVGTDIGEFVEVAGTAGINLADYQIILYNGNGGVVYTTTTLTGTIDNEGSGFGAVAFSYPVDGIQNGAPDGIALYRISTNMVIQFLSYEGVFQATNGPASGMFSTNIGVQELGNEAAGLSLQLTGTGQAAANFTWVGPIAQSPGTINVNQTITAAPSSIAANFMQTEAPGNCPGARVVTRTWTVTDVCGNTATHTQIITVTDTHPPTLTPTPGNITFGCNDPIPPPPSVIATDDCDPAGIVNGPVWINEIHYDNAGVDVNEFIEIAGRAGTNLSGYELFLYNGNGGGTYAQISLSGVIPNQSNGFGTIAFMFAGIDLQNGSPDGIAFVKGGTVLQFLSYEGVMTAVGGPANGMNSTDIGVSETGSEPVGQSLRLSGNGATYAAFTWNGPSAANPATPGQINQGQTFPVQPPVGLPVTYNEVITPAACGQIVTRTWSATDGCGNTVTHTQTITATDAVAPTITCQNVTVNLDAFGNATVTRAQLVPSVSDNCTPAASIVVTPAGPFTFTCAQVGVTQTVTFTATDLCNNTASCVAQITVNPLERCTPKILISDPCVCKNNATTLFNGQFGETIKIEALAGQTWTIIAVNGLYLSNSPAPPGAPIPVTAGMTFTQTPANSGDYYFTGIHIDDLGYSITVQNGLGQTLQIGNSCEYPNPEITADLSGAFCLYSNPVTLTGNPGDANIVSQGFTVNGAPATEFNPGQGVGQYVIVYSVNGGTPKAFGVDDPGCIQTVTRIINVIATPSVLNCNDHIYVSLPSTCVGEILPDDILEGTYGCYDDYFVELDKTLPLGNGPWLGGVLGANDIGKTYQVRVVHQVSGNKCWGLVTIEDKVAPVLVCQDFSIPCNTPNVTPAYLSGTLGILEANPTVSDCQNFTLTYIDVQTQQDCASGLSKIITRKWTAVDASGNSSTCIQTISLIRPTLGDVVTPPDYDGIDAQMFNCTDNAFPTPQWIEAQGLQGFPYVFGQTAACNIDFAYEDLVIKVCDGTYKIRRQWTVLDWCVGDGFVYNQIIKVVDNEGPAFVCPANTTVSIDPFSCCAFVNLPDAIVEDNCSRINNVSGMVVTFDQYTGEQSGMFTFGGTVSNFPGNNLWDLDTLGAFGWTPCLPVGTQTVTYIAEDDCGNTTSCTFRLTVRDYIPPIAVCDETTTVGIGVDDPFDCYGPAGPLNVPVALTGCENGGVTWVKAKDLGDGSYDYCGNVKYTVRRMAPYSDCIQALNATNGTLPCDDQFQDFPSEFERAISEYDSIKFYCCEVGTTQTVVLRVYQVDVFGNFTIGPDGEPVYNECMIQVEVQDKLKPYCQPPAHVTVACEQFDPSLWLYGKAQVLDNCCLDQTKVYQEQCGLTHSASYTQFDTVCNKGTIIRTFRAFDCHGQTSQCTQRVVVNYNQDYFVKFPNDVIVTVCDGTGNYGEPIYFGEDCELLGATYQDAIFTVVPDACFKIERTWKIINWCTYNSNLPCINVPNPNPAAITNAPANLPGPTVSRCGTLAPWAPTVVKINPTDAVATNFCTFWDANANCYIYKQIIKIIDGVAPTVVGGCPDSPVTICDITPNNNQLWNDMHWWDNATQSHDLCEAPADICITATDACSGSNINIEYQLFLDLDGDGVMETIINSINTGIAGLGWNAVPFGNANGGAGTIRTFDGRPVNANQKYGFAIQETISGNTKTACVRFNTQQAQNTFVPAELPYGTHKIKWFISDGCGNESVCEYTIIVKDCKAPTVVCHHGLSVNIMPGGMINMWVTDFLQYTEDNCTPPPYIKLGIRKCNTGAGFPYDVAGGPITSLTFTCDELGQQCVEIWGVDLAGNADYCQTYIDVQDNNGNCGPNSGSISVSGALKTEAQDGIEEAIVTVAGTTSGGGTFNYFDASDNAGLFSVLNFIPTGSNFTITPDKDDNPLNGVTTYDLVLISKHILGVEPLGSPYKMIAADANKSNSLTTFDIVELRKLILGIYQELPNNTSWRFVDKKYEFANPANPWTSVFPENISIATNSIVSNSDFVGLKIGDVNGTAVANNLMTSEDRSNGTLLFDVTDRSVKAGEEFEVTFTASERTQGYQMTLNLNGLEVSEIVGSDNVTANNFGVFSPAEASAKEGALTVSIDGSDMFKVKFRATKSGKLSEMMSVSSRITKAEAYVASAEGKADVALRFDGKTIAGVGFELYQNEPNPFVNKTSVGFHLPEATTATLTVYDETGRLVFTQKGEFAKGYNSISLDRALLNASGILYYTLETPTDNATRKMIQTK